MCLHFVNVSPSEISVSLIRFGPNKFEQSPARLGVYAMAYASPALPHSLACLTASPSSHPPLYGHWCQAHILTGTGLASATSVPVLGSLLPHLHRE
jgi:hypothetical protein